MGAHRPRRRPSGPHRRHLAAFRRLGPLLPAGRLHRRQRRPAPSARPQHPQRSQCAEHQHARHAGPVLQPATLSTAGTILALSAADITGRNCVKRSLSFNLEGLAVYGPFSLQGEYTFNHYDRDPTIITQNLLFSGATSTTAARLFAGAPGGTSVNTSGYYAQAALFLTGETRVSGYTDLEHNVNTPNSFSTAPKILNPISKGGYGAWEVAARYSAINLNNGGLTGLNYLGALGAFNLVPTTSTPANLRQLVALSNSGTIGGRQANMTLGLNWYPEKGFRFLMNYIRVLNNARRSTGPSSTATTPASS